MISVGKEATNLCKCELFLDVSVYWDMDYARLWEGQ